MSPLGAGQFDFHQPVKGATDEYVSILSIINKIIKIQTLPLSVSGHDLNHLHVKFL